MTGTKKEWTIGELRQFLSHLPDEGKLRLLDADTSWTISLMDIHFDTKDKELWFFPSDHEDMIK